MEGKSNNHQTKEVQALNNILEKSPFANEQEQALWRKFVQGYPLNLKDELFIIESISHHQNLLGMAKDFLKDKKFEVENPELLNDVYRTLRDKYIRAMRNLERQMEPYFEKYPIFKERLEKKFNKDTWKDIHYITLQNFKEYIEDMLTFVDNEIKTPLVILCEESFTIEHMLQIGTIDPLLKVQEGLLNFKKPDVERIKVAMIEKRIRMVEQVSDKLVSKTETQKPENN